MKELFQLSLRKKSDAYNIEISYILIMLISLSTLILHLKHIYIFIMKKGIITSLLISLIMPVIAQDQPWFDQNLPTSTRIESFIEAMTLDEKIAQLMNSSPEIDRLGVLPYNWWNECLHGVARNGRATVFPQAIALGATFDEELAFQVATAISDEARAKFNISQDMGNYSQYAGLTFWSPNINIFRDPRWGRGQETYGEDPFLTSRIGVNFIKGLQGDNPKYMKAAACAKHYAVHSGPEELRHEFDAIASKKDLWETYLPAFEAAVTEAHVEAVMGAYNRVNGEAACASPYLLTEVLREQWGFTGHVVSDCGAIQDIWRDHKLVETPEEASAMAIKSGLHLNCGRAFESLKTAVDKGILAEEEIDKALTVLLNTRFKLGLFDPKEENPYNQIGEEVIGSDKHNEIALAVAQKSMVLLKNGNNVLPIEKDIRTIFITGPQAANAEVLLGNYFGISGNTVNFLDGIAARVSAGTTINYKYGQLPFRDNVNPIDWTTEEAAAADACIAVMGISGLYEGEEGEAIASDFKGDRKNIKLPQNQIDFLKKIRSWGDNPLIVVITSGSPVALPEIYEIADAVIYAWYPGQSGGTALADIIFGDISPSGKLPLTVPYSIEDLPPYDDYKLEGRTYRYMEKGAQFPFGFGLSYTQLNIGELELEKTKIKAGEPLSFELEISNKAEIDGEEVIQVYIAQKAGLENQPIASLKAFKRVTQKAGTSQKISFELDADKLELVDENGDSKIFKGDYEVIVGNASPGSRSEELGAVFSKASFTIK